MKPILLCLLVCVGSALITFYGIAANDNPIGFAKCSVMLSAVIAAAAMLKPGVSLNAAVTILLAGATGIAWSAGLYPLAAFATLLVFASVGTDKFFDSTQSCCRVEVVCRLHCLDSVLKQLGRVMLRGFQKEPDKDLITLIVQPEVPAANFGTWLECVRSHPDVLDVSAKPENPV